RLRRSTAVRTVRPQAPRPPPHRHAPPQPHPRPPPRGGTGRQPKLRAGAHRPPRPPPPRHWCGHGHHDIEPGEQYEHWRVPPWRGGNESPRWWTGDRHGDPVKANICAELDAYRQKGARGTPAATTARET